MCSKSIELDEHVRILGVSWNPECDVFQFKVTLNNIIPTSNHDVLSKIARLYNPLGWVTLVTITAEIFMQHL